MQKHRLLEQALPSLFPFSLPPLPPLFAPATQATPHCPLPQPNSVFAHKNAVA